MRIEHSSVLRAYENTQKAAKPEQNAFAAAKEAGAKTDRVSISAEGAKTKAALRAVQTDAVEIENAVTPERLSLLSKQISEGTYNVPAESIAGAMLNIFG